MRLRGEQSSQTWPRRSHISQNAKRGRSFHKTQQLGIWLDSHIVKRKKKKRLYNGPFCLYWLHRKFCIDKDKVECNTVAPFHDILTGASEATGCLQGLLSGITAVLLIFLFRLVNFLPNSSFTP